MVGLGVWQLLGKIKLNLCSVQHSSVAQSCLTLCNPMDCSAPGLCVHHQLSEFTQTHVHWVGDTIQPSHPLLSPSPPAINLSQHQDLSNETALHIKWPKYWSFSITPFNEYQRLIFFRIDWFNLLALNVNSRGFSRVFSSTTVWNHQFFGAQLFLWSNSHIHTWLLEKP